MLNLGDVILFGMLQVCVEIQLGDCVCVFVEGFLLLENLVVDECEVIMCKSFLMQLYLYGMLFVFGLNYVDYVSELEFKLLEELLVFLKVLNIFIGDNQIFVCLNNIVYMYYEVELVVVIGKQVCNVSEVDVMDYVVGYIVCNVYVICDYLENYYCFNLWVKSCDGLMLMFLIIVLKEVILDLYNLIFCIFVNGELCQ